MLIDLKKSNLFTKDPDKRFCEEYLVPLGTWMELWRRYKMLGYTQADLKDYFFIKYGRSMDFVTIARWIKKNEIYDIAKIVTERGGQMVNTDRFGEYEQYVIDEITKQMRYGSSKDSKIII